MGLYDTFSTDEDLEVNGVWIDYGDFRVKIASAGTNNKAFEKYAEKKFKPVRKMIDLGTLGNKQAMRIMADVYAHTVIKDWETKDEEGEWQTGIESPDSEDLLAVTAENVMKTLLSLPRLHLDLQEQANALVNFRRAEMENESGNFETS